MTRAYLDSGVFFMGWRGDPRSQDKALDLLRDESLILVGSPLLRLETLPKATFRNNAAEVRFLGSALTAVSEWIPINDELVEAAIQIGARYDIVNLDALHAAAAIRGGANRFVTTEKPGKPLYRLKEIDVVYLLDPRL